jgi:uncharacterized protein YdeI (YjbR/CyaY-like superfamily)
MSQNLDPRVDAYIARSATFAQPILHHLRTIVHAGCPAATETLKWSFPHFEHAGSILCSMAAFKVHCVFGFWHQGMEKVLGAHGAKSDTAMGSFGRITRIADLPDKTKMLRLVRAAAELNESGVPGRPRTRSKSAKKATPVPPDLTAALQRKKAAALTFESLSPSHRREYIEWITEAKRPETRQRRLETTLAWLADGKARNWKYERVKTGSIES